MKNLRRGLLCLAFGMATAQAADSTSTGAARGLLEDRFTVSLGTFLLDQKTRMSLDASTGSTGTVVDFDRDLGLGDANRFRVDATWRFAPRHKVRALYFSTSNSRTRALERDLTIGDTVYPARAEVSAEASTQILELAYEYVFVRREDYEVSGSAGVHSVRFDFGIEGRGSIAAQPGQPATFRRETAVANAPLPVIGLRGLWQFAPNWYLDGQAQYFSVSIDNVDGAITDLRLGVTRMFGSRFGIGAGWNEFVTDVGIDRRSFDGDLKWRYSGAQIFFTTSF